MEQLPRPPGPGLRRSDEKEPGALVITKSMRTEWEVGQIYPGAAKGEA